MAETILEAVNRTTDSRVNQAVRRTKLEGVDRSNVQGEAVGRELAAGRTTQVAALAPFAESERNRRLAGADLLSNLVGDRDQGVLQRLAAVQQFGNLPRNIEQAINDASFGSARSKEQFQFNTIPDILSRILGGQVSTATTPAAPSQLAQAAPIIGGVAGAFVDGGGFGATGATSSSGTRRTSTFRG